ncbi:His-Xaa-Ser repeat protein HxsA2 [Pseudomonas cichorii]|uniref:His-Xaa-Ser repeat protein HxsA2 n=1 Tax=Pseudomonas cichorii TaxID=36746 RepID=UPI001C8A09F5|nr:His-Xaa-Ser repeat protein HxsA2 [Pseudomonas cichorii]
MKKRSFLVPMATLVAAVATEQASAVVTHEVIEPATDTTHTFRAEAKSENLSVRGGNDLFAFVLKRGDQGQMMAYHSSHSSHASHSSHSSHYSGR